MFDWIPLPIYTDIFYHLMLMVTLVVGHHALHYNIDDAKSVLSLNSLGFFLMVIVVLYMGLRPVSGYYFGDMATYNRIYLDYQNGEPFRREGDVLFHRLMWLCSKFMSAKMFFLFLDIAYIVPMYLFSKVHFRKYWFFALFMFFASFSFWAYGTNGLRNGLGTSLFILGLTLYNRKAWMYFLFFLSFNIHASLIIPILAFFISKFLIDKPKLILFGWLASIPISLLSGSTLGSFIESVGFLEERTQGYLSGGEEYMDQFSDIGFRWDFLAYSFIAILAGWYFIVKKGLNDRFYNHLFGIFALSNAAWILVIEATFSNRFAYLSWFLMGPVIIYPLAKYELMSNQYKVIGAISFLYFMFTYLLNVIL